MCLVIGFTRHALSCLCFVKGHRKQASWTHHHNKQCKEATASTEEDFKTETWLEDGGERQTSQSTHLLLNQERGTSEKLFLAIQQPASKDVAENVFETSCFLVACKHPIGLCLQRVCPVHVALSFFLAAASFLLAFAACLCIKSDLPLCESVDQALVRPLPFEMPSNACITMFRQ